MLTILSLGAAFVVQSQAEPFIRMPDIHGDRVVFISEGDVWLGGIGSGRAHRLTSDAGAERNPQFSPDGTQIAFEAEYDGSRQAYVMPTDGGAPRRLTSVENFRGVTGWTPEGDRIVFRTLGVPTHYAYYTVSAAGGAPTRMPLEFASHVAFGSQRDTYAFTRFNRWSHAWFNYIGGMQNQIWLHEPQKRPGDRAFRQITGVEGTNEFPMWCGGRVYFVNEKLAKFTLMSIDPAGGKARVEAPASPMEIRELDGDGARLIYQQGRDVIVFEPGKKGASELKMSLQSDLLHTRPASVPAEGFVQGVAIGGTGKRALVEARGQILTVPLGDGEARVWRSKSGVRFRHPSMSADGKRVAYVSDESGEQQIYVASSDGTGAKRLTEDGARQVWGTEFTPDGKWIVFTDSKMNLRIVSADSGEGKSIANIPFTWFTAPYSISPDSKWVAYAQVLPGTFFYAIELFEIATGKTVRVSDGRSNDRFPAFTADGKYLAFVADRNISTAGDPIMNQLNAGPVGLICLLALRSDVDDPLAPKDPEEGAPKPEEKKPEFRIDLDGLWDRRIELGAPPAAITALDATQSRLIYLADGNLKYYDVAAKSGGDLGPATAFQVSADRQTILVGRGATAYAINEKGETKKPLTFGGLRLQVEPTAEWKQIFWDAWRHLRDYFYVANMHGVDWKGIGDKYAKLLPSLRSRDELDELIRWMQGELGSSHQYVQTGDGQDIKTRVAGAYLGVELTDDPSGYYRIAKIYRGDGFRAGERSPLLGVGKNVKEGMFLVEVAGGPIKVGQDPYANLAGRAGKVVSIKVNDRPSLEGARRILVTPAASEARMKYWDWVEANRGYVSKASGGRLGYLHLASMGVGSMNDFLRQYFAQRGKEGFVIDVRFNTGGFVQDFINRILSASLTGFFNQRDSAYSWTRQQDFFLGPMACLMNEFNISCGEEFPHRFRDLKRGPLIGRRTMGGEVGSDPGWPLIDGGSVSVPNYGMWTIQDGWVIEGKGVEPDIDVESDPNLYVQGKDPQLDRAISWLLDELKRNPPPKPKLPSDRDRTGGG